MKGDQKAIVIHPGWVKTDMGTQAAPLELPEGVKSALFCIEKVPFDGGNEWNGKFVNS